jgi:hypothetical protein
MLTRRRVIAAKVETTEGTAEAIVVADAGILAFDVKYDADIKMYQRNPSVNTLSNSIPIPGQQSAKVTFRAELKGPGASYTTLIKPALSPYFRACGFAETLVAATSVTYLPASTGVPSLTIWVYEDGMIKKIKGARGNVKLSGKVGEPIVAEFEFTGVYDGVIDGTMITPTFEGSVPPIMMGTTFTIDSYAAVISSISIDMANKLELRDSVVSTSGYLSTLLSDRNPTGKLDPEATTVAAYDWYGKWKGGTSGALSLGAIGTTAFNRYTITAPKCVYTGIAEGDRAGMMVNDTTFALAMNTGDDEISIAFT